MKLFDALRSIGLIAAVLLTTNFADAQDVFRYRLSGNWTTITDGTTEGWGLNPNNDGSPGSELPGAGDEARINWGGNVVTVDSAVPELNRIRIGVDEDGILDVNSGGVLSVTEDIHVGNNGFVDGTMNVNSGAEVNVGRILWVGRGFDTFGFLNVNAGAVVNVASHLWWGADGDAFVDISGTVNQTGGILGLGTFAPETSLGTGTATVNILSGGELNLNNIFTTEGGTNSIQPGSVIDLQGTGRLTVPNDFTSALGNYVAAGLITGNGQNGAVDLTLEFGSISGDFNEDGVVDAADYTVFRDNVGDINGLPNDDGLGVVGQLHYDLWESQFGMVAPVQTVATAAVPAATAVPEPSAFGIACLLAMSGWCCSRKR